MFVVVFFFSIPVFSQSNHTVSFTNSASDFNALEKISAASGGTDYYITFDQNNLYIGAFKVAGFAANDNLVIYIDTDPQAVSTSGNGSATGKLYNGVTATLPFKADFNVYAEEAVQQANSYSAGWIAFVGPSYSTSANSREVKVPFAGMGNPYALNITMWIGNTGSVYSNAPGANIASSATPAIVNYFGTFGIKNGAQGNVNPVNVITSPAVGYLSGATSIAGGVYAYVDITANATISGLTLAPGGVINVEAGKTLTSTGTINNTASINNTKSTQINVSGIYTLQARVFCSAFNVNNGATYTHNVAGSVADGAAQDWPGIDTRTYGATSNVNISQWATTNSTLPIGIPAPTSGGWGNVTINVSQTYGGNWNQKGAFNNIAGNLTLNKLGTNLTPSPVSFTFNQQLPGATINIGGNFDFSAGSKNNVFICEPSNPGPSGADTHIMNVHGDFIVNSGHLKFAYHYATVVINSWGSYIQTGADVQAITNPGQAIVIINSYGVNKILSVTPSASTSFNTNDINWYIQNGAVINVATALPFGGKSQSDPTNINLTVNGTLNCNNYKISSSNGSTATFTLSPGGTLGIGAPTGIAVTGSTGNIQMTNRIFSTQANYVYNGTSSQITGTGLPATVNSLTINNSGSATNSTVSLTNSVTITSFHEIDKGIFSLGNNNVTLHSDANATASFNKLGTGANINYSGTGRYIVERYINSGIGAGQHGKAWMFLSTPANDAGLTVYNSWQESRSNIIGYGTWITDPSGTANGFDAVSVTPSMKSYDPLSDGWIGIPSTNIAISNPEGYFIYIRGDRSVTASVPDPTPTTLRIKGKLFIGNQPAITVPSNSFQSIGNPYASAVDFKKLYASSSNIDNTFYAWDPSVAGTYGAGAYQTVSGTTGYIAVPGGSGIYKTNTDYSSIQSGEAIMVYNSAASSGSVNFTEDCKTTGSILVARQATPLSKNQILFANLYTSSGALADGNAVAFSNSFSNKVDKDDALKIANAGENFGIKRNSKNLAIEARSPVQVTDTIFYAISNLKLQGYRLLFVPQNINTGLSAYLIDHYLKTEKQVSLSDSISINFSITQDSASSSSGRFMIVFRTNDALPVTFVSVKAFRQNQYILVEWKVENENGLKEYGVERSTDGTHFLMLGVIPALNISKAMYPFPDNNPAIGNNYYRIRSLDMDGKIKYSAVVTISNENIKSSISVYPNPLVDGKINLQFVSQPSGNYGIRLFNSAGQELLVKTINHSADNMSETIQLGGNLPHGIYQLEITGPGGEKQLIKVSK